MTDGKPIPLRGVAVEAHLRDLATEVTITQRYANAEAHPIEAVYVFPLEEGSAVCGFEAWIGNVHVVGAVKERDAAFEDYDDALAAGHGAYLLDQERPDVFTASIGNVPSGAEVLIRIRYVAEVTLDGDALGSPCPRPSRHATPRRRTASASAVPPRRKSTHRSPGAFPTASRSASRSRCPRPSKLSPHPHTRSPSPWTAPGAPLSWRRVSRPWIATSSS